VDRYRVWEILSYAWSEIGIEDEECRSLVRKGEIKAFDLPEADKLFFRDVCASFAVDSFLVVPLMLWMLMPDWGYSEEYLRNRMARWYSKPYWRHFINPLRVLGYPVALLFAWRYRSMLRRAVRAESGA
jgi:hypothetical protein